MTMRRRVRALMGGAAMLALGMTAAADVTIACDNPNALGVSRTVQIDTTGGPGFGMDHYKAHDFLQDKEVVLTFDDGPQKFATEDILAALAQHCTKATFFSVGKMALGYPHIIRRVAREGHTVGTHTWSHKNIRKAKSFDKGKDEIERGISAVRRAVGGPISPFFRYPTLQDSPESLAHLASRNISMWSTDIDSFDFKLQKPEVLAKSIIDKLEKRGKGIVLMHDIHRNTARALPLLLDGLKAKGFKIVHITAAAEVATLPEFDEAIEKDARGLPQAGTERPTSSIVKTIEGTPPPEETEAVPEPAAVSEPPAAPRTDAPANAVPPRADTAPPSPEQASNNNRVSNPVTETSSIVTAVPSHTVESGSPSGAEAPDDSGGVSRSLSDAARDAWKSLFSK